MAAPTNTRARVVAQLVYGAEVFWRDPVKFSFAHGGKDGVPFPVDRPAMDGTIRFLREVLKRPRSSADTRSMRYAGSRGSASVGARRDGRSVVVARSKIAGDGRRQGGRRSFCQPWWGRWFRTFHRVRWVGPPEDISRHGLEGGVPSSAALRWGRGARFAV